VLVTETLLLLLYGAIVIASAFVIGSMSFMAFRESTAEGPFRTLQSTYFWLAACVALASTALALICGFRTVDGLRGIALGGSWGWGLVVGFTMLFVAYLGFNWAGSRTVRHGRTIWRTLLVALFLWTAFVALRSFAG
jgi:hypothetical protein